MLLRPVGRDPQKKIDPSTIIICQPYSTPTGNYSIWSVLCSSSRLEVSHPIWLRTEHPFFFHTIAGKLPTFTAANQVMWLSFDIGYVTNALQN